jgi:hypothetical protein
MPSSLRERLGHRVRVADASRVHYGSPVAYLLRAEPTFVKTVSAALTLARRHLRLGVATDVVERLFDKEEVTVEVPKVEDPEVFEREMGELGIQAIRRETEPEAAKALAVNAPIGAAGRR